MKEVKSVTVTCCDFCGKDNCFHQCMNCGKDICYDCLDRHAVQLPHAIYCMGTGDGEYCEECARNSEVQRTPLFQSYQKIRSLKDELFGFHERFDICRKKAEAKCKAEYEQWEKTKKEANGSQ